MRACVCVSLSGSIVDVCVSVFMCVRCCISYTFEYLCVLVGCICMCVHVCVWAVCLCIFKCDQGVLCGRVGV